MQTSGISRPLRSISRRLLRCFEKRNADSDVGNVDSSSSQSRPLFVLWRSISVDIHMEMRISRGLILVHVPSILRSRDWKRSLIRSVEYRKGTIGGRDDLIHAEEIIGKKRRESRWHLAHDPIDFFSFDRGPSKAERDISFSTVWKRGFNGTSVRA